MSDLIRAFVAIEIPDPLRSALWAGTAQARAVYPEGKWVSAGNLHLTVKFLGNVEPERVPAVGATLDPACARHNPYPIALKGLGTFPGAARVIWAGITEGGEETGQLARDVDSALALMGFAPEARPFRPHLTIARAGRAGVTAAAMREFERLHQAEWGRFRVERISLMQSILRPQGPIYRALSHHQLNRLNEMKGVLPSSLS